MRLRGPDPVPARRFCSLRYCQNVTIGSSATAHTFGTSFDVRLNSLFDPTNSSPHQPFYFDQMATFYYRYRVNRAHVVVEGFPVDASDVMELTALMSPPSVGDTIGGATTDIMLEKYQLESVKLQQGGSMASGRLEYDLPMTLATGLTNQQLSNEVETYAALVSAAPAVVPLLQIACANVSQGAAKNVRLTVLVTFDCEFWERKIPSQS